MPTAFLGTGSVSWQLPAGGAQAQEANSLVAPLRFLMLSLFRLAVILTVIFAVCGPASAQAIAPAGAGVKIDKVVIDNGGVHTVKYYVTGGSPQLQAMVRRVEWAENELSVIEQLQLLKLDTVVNERRVASFRTAQLTNPYYPPGFIPVSIPTDGGDCEGSLQRALKWQLAAEATPQAAMQMIGFLEQVQTELDAQLKALPPQEKKAVQGPIDALRPRVAALPRLDVSLPQSQPVVPRQVSFPAGPGPVNEAAAPTQTLSNPPPQDQQSPPLARISNPDNRQVILSALLTGLADGGTGATSPASPPSSAADGQLPLEVQQGLSHLDDFGVTLGLCLGAPLLAIKLWLRATT